MDVFVYKQFKNMVHYPLTENVKINDLFGINSI